MTWAALPGGDPSLLGWMTFVLYLAAALCCLRRASLERGLEQGMPRAWILLAAGLLLLGLNKQLDLQTDLTELGRRWALAQGYYSNRRFIQRLLFAVLLVALVVVAAIHFKALVRFAHRQPVCVTGCAVIGVYVLLRIASFERVDEWLGFSADPVKGLALEMAGLGLVLFAALRRP